MPDRQKQEYDKSLLEELINHPAWELVDEIIRSCYDSADEQAHSITGGNNRDFYAGKCGGVKDVQDALSEFKDNIKYRRSHALDGS